MPRGRIATPMESRFAANVIPVSDAPCLLWTGSVDRDGYGVISGPRIDGKSRQWRAHIYAWTLAHGAVPPDMLVLHHCDVRPCVNAYGCLFLGTNDDNMADMAAKGRGRYPGNPTRGQDRPSAKLQDWQVREIRNWRRGDCRRADLAARFGISESLVKRIRAGECWKHLL